MKSALIIFLLLSTPAWAFDAKTLAFDELIFHVQRYGSTAEKREVKAAAREELFARRAEALRAVMGKVHLENVMIQVLAQELVEQLKPEETAPVLVEFLTSEKPRTRKIAAFLLGLHETPQYADKITPLLSDEEACGAAIRTLGKWHVKSAVPAIIPFLTNPKEPRRIVAINALRDIGDPAAIPALTPSLNDRYFTVRRAAERAVKELQ